MTEKSIAERIHEGQISQSLLEERIYEAWGQDENPAGVVSHIGSDYYDNSLEIYLEPHVGDEGMAHAGRAQIIYDMGFERFWVNWKDGTEQCGTGPRKMKARGAAST